MRLEVSDEGGTKGFGMEVIEGCDRAKDFSIKAPWCVHRSSEWGCLLAMPHDQSWKTERATVATLKGVSSLQVVFFTLFPISLSIFFHSLLSASELTHTHSECHRQTTEELRLIPGYRGAPVIGKRRWTLSYMTPPAHTHTQMKQKEGKGMRKGRKKEREKGHRLSWSFLSMTIFFTGC